MSLLAAAMAKGSDQPATAVQAVLLMGMAILARFAGGRLDRARQQAPSDGVANRFQLAHAVSPGPFVAQAGRGC
jgi:hypothetical protein